MSDDQGMLIGADSASHGYASGQTASGGIVFSRGTSLLLASCGAVATAAYLGTTWLTAPIFGLPTGVWIIGIVQGTACAIWYRQDQRQGAAPAGGTARPRPGLHTGLLPASSPLLSSTGSARPTATPVSTGSSLATGAIFNVDLLPPLGRLAAVACDAVKAASHGMRVSGERVAQIEDELGARLDATKWWGSWDRSLRIGLDVETELARVLAGQFGDRASSGLPVQWVPIPAGMDDRADLRRHRLDALIRRRDGAVRIVTLEHDGRDAAWYDWAVGRPLTYASTFPLRLDPARITLDEVATGDAAEARLVGQLAIAAASYSRTAARLTLSDRLAGRRPTSGPPSPAPDLDSGPSLADACMKALAEQIASLAEAQTSCDTTPAQRAAARAVSAWLATTEAWIDMDFRRNCLEGAAVVLGHEPEVMLRLGAVRFAAGDDQAGYDALVSAFQLIRRHGCEPIVDHAAFLESELQLGTPGPLTLGRVAAGICLVCATSRRESIAYVRGDLMDDIRYSSWLVGRDQDRAMLMEVFRRLEQGEGHQPGSEPRCAA